MPPITEGQEFITSLRSIESLPLQRRIGPHPRKPKWVKHLWLGIEPLIHMHCLERYPNPSAPRYMRAIWQCDAILWHHLS